MKEIVLWTLVSLSSVAAAIYAYHRFKLIRPDLFNDRNAGTSEAERVARIAEYQKKGDALSRAAAVTREPKTGEACVDGAIVRAVREAARQTRPVIENGQPVRCRAEIERR